MYKNTVPKRQANEGVLVRVRGCDECDAEVASLVDACTKEGVRVLVFPDEDLLISWRQRLAALA